MELAVKNVEVTTETGTEKNGTAKGHVLEQLLPSSITGGDVKKGEGDTSEEKQAKDASDKEKDSSSPPPPQDKYKLVYLIMVLHGVGSLMPWNMFINAKDYYENYKLGGTNPDTKWYSTNFLTFFVLASQLPNLIFGWVNTISPCGGSLKVRIIISLTVEIAVCILTVILSAVNTAETPALFFWMTMLSVVAINTAGGFYQNSVYGIGARMGYAAVLVLGSNLSGVFTSVTSLVVLSTGTSASTSALFYFGTATLTMILCLVSYLQLPTFKFYQYHHQNSTPTTTQETEKAPARESQRQDASFYLSVLKHCWLQCFNVFMVFFVSLAVFPAIHANVKVLNSDFLITDDNYFREVTCFLTFNVWAFIGNLCAGWVQWPKPKYLWMAVTLRLLFIPIFLLCNYHPNGFTRSSPVVFGDWVYWIAGVVLGLTNGYFSSLAMMYCPGTVKKEHAPTAGMFGAAFLVTGVFVGANFSVIMPYLV